MGNSFSQLDQALKDLVESYMELHAQNESKYGGDLDSLSNAMIETLETSIESALEEHDISTNLFATMLSNFTEALEQLDPSAFDEDEDEMAANDMEMPDEDYDDEDMDLDEE